MEVLIAFALVGGLAVLLSQMVLGTKNSEVGLRAANEFDQTIVTGRQLLREKNGLCKASFQGKTFDPSLGSLATQEITGLSLLLPPPATTAYLVEGQEVNHLFKVSQIALKNLRVAGEGLYLADLEIKGERLSGVPGAPGFRSVLPVPLRATVAGNVATIDGCLDDSYPERYYVISNPDYSTYECLHDIDIKDVCGDFDGCTMKIIMQHEAHYDQVRHYEVYLTMEQPSLSNNTYAGVYGWSQYTGGGEVGWITGTASRYTMAHPWDWMWMFNYKHSYCPGQSGHSPAYADPYKVTLMSHPHVKTTVIFID